MDNSSITAWASQAISYGKEFQPTMYKELEKEGMLYLEARKAADQTDGWGRAWFRVSSM